MDSLLFFQGTVGELSVNVHGALVDGDGFPAAFFRVAEIHPEKHIGPVAGLSPAGTGMDAYNSIFTVILPG